MRRSLSAHFARVVTSGEIVRGGTASDGRRACGYRRWLNQVLPALTVVVLPVSAQAAGFALPASAARAGAAHEPCSLASAAGAPSSSGSLVKRVTCSFDPVQGPFDLKLLPDVTPTPVPQPSPGPVPTPPPEPAPPPSPVVDPGFRYHPPGDLLAKDANRGRAGDRHVYLPDIIFPMRLADGQHPHMNSQIWGRGGGGWAGKGAAGGTECDAVNYDPHLQRDNFCEVRDHQTTMCPAGKGHQGQDIRPPSCKDNTWEVLAAADGIVTLVTKNTTVRVKADDGTNFEYLHMHPNSIKVSEGDRVKQGDVLGRVSKYMQGQRITTLHLHFQVLQNVKIGEKVLKLYVPVYSSLIAAYRKQKGLAPSIDTDGNLITDHRTEIGVAPPPEPVPPTPTPTPEPTPTPPAPTPTPTPEPTPTPPAPTPTPVPEPTPTPPAPTPTPVPEPTPTPPAPTPTPVPEPTPTPPAPTPTPVPEPTPTPPAPTPTPTPEPAPTPPAPAPEPAPTPPEPEKSWYQRGWDTVVGWVKSWWN